MFNISDLGRRNTVNLGAFGHICTLPLQWYKIRFYGPYQTEKPSESARPASNGENVPTYSARKKIWHGKNSGTSPPLRMRWPYISQNARRIQVNAVSEVQSDVGTHQGAEDEIWETAGVAPSV